MRFWVGAGTAVIHGLYGRLVSGQSMCRVRGHCFSRVRAMERHLERCNDLPMVILTGKRAELEIKSRSSIA